MLKLSGWPLAMSAALVLLAAGVAPAGQYPKMTLRAGMWGSPPNYYTVSAQLLADKLKEKTGGQITMNLFPNFQLGSERDMLEAVQLGTLDVVVTSTGPVGGFVQEVLALDFPFLFRDTEHAYKVLDGPIGRSIRDKFPAKNLIALAWVEAGWRQLSNSVRPVKTPDDVKGLKIRTMENDVHIAAFRALGANPVPMPSAELYNALQQKVVDGQENPYASIWNSKVYEVQKYISQTAHVYSPALVIMSKQTWDKFPADIQKMVLDLEPALSKVSRDFAQKADVESVAKLKEKGIQIIAPVDRTAFMKAMEPVYEKLGPRAGPDVIRRIREVK